MDKTLENLANLERARCAALMAGDIDALAALLAEEIVHVHLTGQTDGRAAYLEGVAGKYEFRDIERPNLTIRLFGGTAVMTGLLTQKVVVRETGQVHDIRAMTTQVWHDAGDGYLLNTCHNAPITA